jgi:hypothetical protein
MFDGCHVPLHGTLYIGGAAIATTINSSTYRVTYRRGASAAWICDIVLIMMQQQASSKL